MRERRNYLSYALALAIVLHWSSAVVAADQMILAVSQGGLKWTWNGKESTDEADPKPLIVEAKVGDVLKIEIKNGRHGFATIDGPINDDPEADDSFVLKCGEKAANKPNAVLRETGPCVNGQSRFDKVRTGAQELITLEVMDKFANANPVHFWCTQHEASMWGTIKLSN